MHFSVVILFVIFYLPAPTKAEYFYYECDYSTGNYTANSTYQSNLNQLFSALRSNASATGCAAGTVGAVPDQVTGIAMCRGDLSASACSACLSRKVDALNLCNYSRTVLMWYNSCYMYYSSRYFLSSKANKPKEPIIYTANVTDDPTRYENAMLQLMSKMKSWAVNNSTKFFATGMATNFSTEWPIIYGLVQCTLNLNKSQCQDCLQELINEFPRWTSGYAAGRMVGIYCNIRYEVDTFYDGPAMLQIDGTVSSQENVNSLQYMESIDSLLIDFSTLKAGTSNFHESNKLGGGFGAVYKGILPNGEEVAVKRLSQSSGQGLEELKNELVIVAKLQHKNLVQLVGICLEKQEGLLVYEFMPNGSLDTILFGNITLFRYSELPVDNEKRQELDWRRRQRIINGLVRGLQYLHEDSQLTIVHRDLKASNILLDSNMNPKISDFGLARLFHADQTAHATSRVVGTFGYMAPEYAMHGLYSTKSDVYSFGVLFLEILTGRGNCGSFDGEQGEDLLSSIWEKWIAGTVNDIMDPILDCPIHEIIRHVQIGLLCVQEIPAYRPRMSEVVAMLSNETVSLEAPSKPAFYLRRGDNSYSESTSVDKSLLSSHIDASISQPVPR